MLGTSAQNLQYQSLRDFQSPADYLRYMFNGLQGVLYRATINPQYRQSFYRASGLVKAEYKGVDNCYIGMNSFFRTSGLSLQDGRSVKHLKRLNALYVDIDCYKQSLSKQEVLLRLEDEYIGNKIPEPTFIIDSGRGIYLIWKLRNEDARALPRWTAVEQYLTSTLTELGADSACTDAARILRVPGSRNSKSKTKVSILAFNDLTYSIYDIAKEYGIQPTPAQRNRCKVKKRNITYPYGHATERQRKYVRDIAGRLGLTEEEYPNFEDFHDTDNWIKLHSAVVPPHRGEKKYCHQQADGTYSFAEFKSMRSILGSYCAEIRKLFTMRKGGNCKRELGLFLYRYFLREMKCDRETALQETLSFNASLDCPFDEHYVTTVTASADRRIERGIPYAYRKSTIINMLEITKKELEHLPFFSKEVKTSKEQRKEQNRRAYEAKRKAHGKAAKKDAVLKRRAIILSLREEGMTAAAIQKALGISRATYHRDVAALALKSVCEAARAVLASQMKNIITTAEQAAGAVSDAITSVKECSPVAAFYDALISAKKQAKQVIYSLSHFFSIPFIEMNAVGVPHRAFPLSETLQWIIHYRLLSRGSEDDSEGY